MAKDKKEALASLKEFLGKGDGFEVGAHKYNVRPLTVGEAIDFLADELPVNLPVYLLLPQFKEKTDRWLKAAVTDAEGNPVGIDVAISNDWPLDKLKECLERLVMLSG